MLNAFQYLDYGISESHLEWFQSYIKKYITTQLYKSIPNQRDISAAHSKWMFAWSHQLPQLVWPFNFPSRPESSLS